MGAAKSYTSFDYKPGKMVPVVASFDTSGHIVPLWVRINGAAYKINSFWISSHFLDICEYRCKIIDGDYQKPLTLIYYGKERIWFIDS